MNELDISLPSEEVIIEIHDIVLDVSGGLKGIRDKTIISAAVHRPKTYIGYVDKSDIHTVCGVILDSLARNHAFA